MVAFVAGLIWGCNQYEGGGTQEADVPADSTVSQIINAGSRATHTDHWQLTSDSRLSAWSFFGDGTGAYRDGVLAPSGRIFSWQLLGPDSITISGMDWLPGIPKSWTAIAGTKAAGRITVVFDRDQEPRTLTLETGTLLSTTGPPSGTLFLTDPLTASIHVLNRSHLEPIWSIRGKDTLLNAPTGIDIYHDQDELFVANSGSDSITVYGVGAAGNESPLREIIGPNTRLAFSRDRSFLGLPFNGIEIDTVNNEVAIVCDASSPPSIRFFRLSDTGNVPPLRSIQGPSTTLITPVDIAIDATSNELFVTNLDGAESTVLVFSLHAVGDAEPLRTLRIPPLNNPTGIAIDVAHDELWVVGSGNDSSRSGLLIYARAAAGFEGPIRSGRAMNPQLQHRSLYVDAVAQEAGVLRMQDGSAVLDIVDRANGTVIESVLVGAEVGIAYMP